MELVAGRTREQQTTIGVLLDEHGDFHVEPPLERGTLELRTDGKHLCFVLADGKIA